MGGLLAWELRLLLSVDLVGSTALKQRSAMVAGDLEPWLPWLRGFYDAFPAFLEATYAHLPQPLGRRASHLPELWKYNGDEVLLQVQLHDYREALEHVMALKQAVCQWRDGWAAPLAGGHAADPFRKRRFPLEVKATAWLAGFPVSNAFVYNEGGQVVDLVGPQVDLGFRLSRLATRTHLVVDAGLAYLLAEALTSSDAVTACRLSYLGRQQLDGILEGQPYPVFAVQAEHALADTELGLAGTRQVSQPQVGPQDVVRFCQEYHRDTLGVARPFIWQDLGGRFDFDQDLHGHLERRRLALATQQAPLAHPPDLASSKSEHAEQPAVDEAVALKPDEPGDA